MKVRSVLAVGCLLAIICAGCGTKEISGHRLTGSVIFDQKALDKGWIEFFPKEDQGRPVGTAIVNGKYECHLDSGKYRVLITAYRVTGKEKVHPEDPNSEYMDLTEQYIPGKYNSKSTLECIVPSTAEVDFSLTGTK